jgi:uncharacterized protein (TIRG00374 family)
MTTRKKPASKKLFSWSNVIFLILCAAVFYFVVHDFTELKTIKSLFEKVDLSWILVAIAAQALTYLSTATLYYFLLNKFKGKTSVTLADFFKLSIVIVFINQIVPSGGVGGNGFLFSELTKRKVTPKKAFFTIIMECLCLYVALALLIITLPIIYISYHHGLPHLFWIVIAFGILLYGGLATSITILSNKNTLHKVIKKLARIKFLKRHLEDIDFSPEGTFPEYNVKGPWQVFLKYKAQSAVVIAGQLGVFFADSFTIVALLHGLHVHIAYIVVAFGLLLTFITAALPISPGALLVYEGAMTFFYTSMGMPFQTALIVTLLFRVLSFWTPIVLGLILYKNVQTDST